MRILTTYHPEHLIFNGVVAALTAIEKDLISWLTNQKPAFDAFDERRPELFICLASDITPELTLPLQQYQTPTIVFDSSYRNISGINVKMICPGELSVHNPSSEAITHSIGPAANVAQFNSGKYNEKYACDVLYVSNTHLNSTHSTMIGKLQNKSYTTRVCGPIKTNLTNYVGNCSIKTLTDMMASSKIVIDVDRNILFDAAFNDTFCLTNVQNDFFASYSSEDEFFDQIKHFLASANHRKAYIKKAKEIAKNHTYFHRVYTMCDLLNLSELADKSMKVLDQIQ